MSSRRGADARGGEPAGRARAGLGAGHALVALTALAAVLRFATLDTQSFWLDEAATVELLRLDLGALLHRIPESESTPPLYYLLAWPWAKLFGTGEVGLRSLSALLGTAFVPAAYAAAARLCSRRAGLAVAALASVNPLLVWYSQEARAYALLALLTAVSLWAFARVLERPSRGALALWAVASALALASHYFAAFLVLPEAVWLTARPDVRRRALPALAVVIGTAGALAPLALYQRSLGLASFIAGEPLVERVARAGKNFLLGFDSPLETAVSLGAAAIAVCGAVAAFTLTHGPERRGARVALALGGLAFGLPLALAGLDVDYLDTRNLLGTWLPLMLVAAAGLATRRSGRLGVAGLALLCVLGLVSVVGVALEPRWQRDDWRGIAAALGRPEGVRAVVVQPASGARPLRLYLPELRSFPAGTVVRELAVVYPLRRTLDGEHPSPPPSRPPPPPPGFDQAALRRTEGYTVALAREPEPRYLTRADAAFATLVPGEPSTVLLQGP